MRRFTRLTIAFSKKVENRAYAVALHMMYYNFVRIHKTLRVTPAMAANVTDRLWEIADIVKLVEDAEAKPGKRGPYKRQGAMTPRAMIERIWGTHWGIRRALLVWLAMAAAFLLYAKLGGLEGNYAPAKAPFSRQACLNRETNYYRSRNPDMGAMSDELISRIAAICAREESDHYYSN